MLSEIGSGTSARARGGRLKAPLIRLRDRHRFFGRLRAYWKSFFFARPIPAAVRLGRRFDNTTNIPAGPKHLLLLLRQSAPGLLRQPAARWGRTCTNPPEQRHCKTEPGRGQRRSSTTHGCSTTHGVAGGWGGRRGGPPCGRAITTHQRGRAPHWAWSSSCTCWAVVVRANWSSNTRR